MSWIRTIGAAGLFGAVGLAVLATGCASRPAAGEGAVRTETRAQKDRRMEWWREARFGMFIHWGLYAVPAGQWDGKKASGTGEWIMRNAKIPVGDYEKLRDQFNPVKFDAAAWAKLARTAGMKYVVITTKHHDGFALYDSAVSDYDIMSTPFKRDIMQELATAVRRQGMTMCWYHSILDWHHPDYLPRLAWDPRPAAEANFDRYNAYLNAQVSELLTRYGPIGVMWFDGEWENHWDHARGQKLYDLCRTLQPATIVNNRVDKGRNDMAGLNKPGEWAGDFGTPEQEVPAKGFPGVDWESCMTMNDTWGYRVDDEKWKSGAQLVRTLCETASKGGNFLLNVGPTALGEIPPASVERLEYVGRWMDKNSEAIYETNAGPFEQLPWGRCTAKGRTLYLHVFDFPADGKLTIPGLQTDPSGAVLLTDGRSLRWTRSGENVVLDLAQVTPDEAATVIKLQFRSPPRVVEVPIVADASGVLRLDATTARVDRASPRLEHRDGKTNLGFWTDGGSTVFWPIQLSPGVYKVEAEIACTEEDAGKSFEFAIGDQSIRQVIPDTGGWGQFRTVTLGEVRVPASGKQAATVRAWPADKAFSKGALMNLRTITASRISALPREVAE